MLSTSNTAKVATANKILLVEDNPGDARLVEIYLAESDLHDHPMIHKTTLGDALEFLKEEKNVAGILLDLTLPDSSGPDTLEVLLNQFPYSNVIVLTGLTDKQVGLRCVQTGAQDYLIKGEFDQDQLSKSLRFSIERARVLKRLEETQDIAHIGSWEYHPESNYFLASNEMYRIVGRIPNIRPRTDSDSIENDCVFKLLHGIHQQASIYGEFHDDIEIKREDGSIRYAFVECRFQENHKGKVSFQGILQDITERKLSEQEAAESKERYQEIFSQSKDAILVCNPEGRLMDFNHATIDLFGFNSEELLSDLEIRQLFYTRENFNEFIAKLKERGSVKDFDIYAIRKDGSFRDCLLSATIGRTSKGSFYSCIVRDITEQKQTERLRKEKELAEQAAKMREQFVASISHEMRTPMNAIFGMSNLLEKSNLDSEQADLVDSIKKSSEVLLGIINDILDISSIQNNRVNFDNKIFDLHSLLENVVKVMQYKAVEKDLSIRLSIAENVPQLVIGDPLRLNQILYNLIGNGIKFSEKGYVELKVKKLHDILESVQLFFEVEDSGIGIPADKLDSIFDSFSTIRYKDKVVEGTGLGLSIVKNLIEMQGGKIRVESSLDAGSRFSFDLLYESALEPELHAEQDYPDIDGLDDSTPIRLLLMEDHKMNQLVATKTLRKRWESIEIDVAENGAQGIEFLMAKNYDIILMDIQMPVMDGYEATRIIRHELPPEKARTPIIAMTAHAHISMEEKFKLFGMDDFVLKPFEPKELYYKVLFHKNKNAT